MASTRRRFSFTECYLINSLLYTFNLFCKKTPAVIQFEKRMKRDCDTSVKCGEMVAVTEKIVWKKTYFDFN